MTISKKHKGFKVMVGDESNPTFGIAVDETSHAMHVCDATDAATDWNVAADSDPSVYIHCADANAATDYVKIYHNDTNGIIDCDGTTVLSLTASGVTVTGDSAFTDKITFSDQAIHANAIVETLTGNKTLDAQDVGKVFEAPVDGTVITLPATAVGIMFTVVNTGADAAAKVSISPATADKIMGPDIAGADNKDLINTKTTAIHGDLCTLIADGSAGWYVAQLHGTWAAET